MRSSPGNGSAIEKVLAVLEALPELERRTPNTITVEGDLLRHLAGVRAPGTH